MAEKAVKVIQELVSICCVDDRLNVVEVVSRDPEAFISAWKRLDVFIPS